MLGHTFWSDTFSRSFCEILEQEYELPETAGKLWESLFIAHLDRLKMKVRQYDRSEIYEFDTLDELCQFDPSYQNDTRSPTLKKIASQLGAQEAELTQFAALKNEKKHTYGFSFYSHNVQYCYTYSDSKLRMCAEYAEKQKD